jgi:hypothetical protein
VRVRLGCVPSQLKNASAAGVCYQAKRGQLLLNVERVARYLISSGNEIVVEVLPGSDQSTVLLYLFGPAFGAILHQRGILPVHSSAVATGRGAVVFAGASGHGKSTLAVAFHQRGFRVLADDVCPIATSGCPNVLPANPFLMIWADTANRLGINQRHLRRASSDAEKYVFPLGDAFAAESVPLHAIYVLEPSNSDDFTLVPIRGLQKIQLLNQITYRPAFIEGMNLNGQHFRQIGEVARQTKVIVVKRPLGGFRIDELADLLAADFSASAGLLDPHVFQQ